MRICVMLTLRANKSIIYKLDSFGNKGTDRSLGETLVSSQTNKSSLTRLFYFWFSYYFNTGSCPLLPVPCRQLVHGPQPLAEYKRDGGFTVDPGPRIVEQTKSPLRINWPKMDCKNPTTRKFCFPLVRMKLLPIFSLKAL